MRTSVATGHGDTHTVAPTGHSPADPPSSPSSPSITGYSWDGELLAAFAAAGCRPKLLRQLVAAWPDPAAYEDAWAQPGQAERMRAQGYPDPHSPAVDLGDGWVITETDPVYPAHLRGTPAAPFLLFGRGERSTLASPGVAVVGTRNITRIGATIAPAAARAALQAGAVVISGLAAGVDTTAHRTATEAGAATIAVVATGPDHCYPPQNAALVDDILHAGGAVLSEHPFRTGAQHAPGYNPAPMTSRLMARNRIIAALSALTVPCEGTTRSGVMNCVWATLRLGRPVVVAVPRPGAQGAPGAQLALALASTRALSKDRLTAVGAPAAVAEQWAGRSPLAAAVTHDVDELTTAIATLWAMSPYQPATASAASNEPVAAAGTPAPAAASAAPAA